jgi:hypothetical protein
MEDCIIIGFDSGCCEIRIRKVLEYWIVEERGNPPPRWDWYGKPEYSDWKPFKGPDGRNAVFQRPLEALKWVANKSLGWREDRPSEAKPEAHNAHIRVSPATVDADDWDNDRIPF